MAYPSFTEYVTRAKRQVAQEALYRITSQQEQFFADNKSYADSLEDLGYPSWLMAVNDEGDIVEFSAAEKNYGMRIIWPTGPDLDTVLGYTVYVFPYGAQWTRDQECGLMTLNQAGTRYAYGGSDDCW